MVKPFIGDPKNLGQEDKGIFREDFETQGDFADANYEFQRIQGEDLES